MLVGVGSKAGVLSAKGIELLVSSVVIGWRGSVEPLWSAVFVSIVSAQNRLQLNDGIASAVLCSDDNESKFGDLAKLVLNLERKLESNTFKYLR